jgi:5,10-methylene-tetrahydrofolate dehydrogenase/methenyl tetrahydrofolate cyclohydrolase
MTAQIIDGKEFAAGVRKRVKAAAEAFRSSQGKPVGLTVVLVGNDPASEIYVRLKVSDAREVVSIDSRDRTSGSPTPHRKPRSLTSCAG